MAVTALAYGKSVLSFMNSEIDISSDTLKVMLCTSSYTPNQDTHQYKSSVTNEVTGTGYTAGGVALTSLVASYDNATNKTKIDAADAVWSDSTITARYAVVYDDTPATDAAKPLLSVADFGADFISTAGTFTVQWDSSGIYVVTAA